MAMADQAGWEQGTQGDGMAELRVDGAGESVIGLGFGSDDIVGAALVQEEVIDFTVRGAREAAAERKFIGTDPRDLDPRDLL